MFSLQSHRPDRIAAAVDRFSSVGGKFVCGREWEGVGDSGELWEVWEDVGESGRVERV